MKFIISGLLLCLTVNCTLAQKSPLKFGVIPLEDLKMTVYDKDTSASAVVLADYGEAYIRVTSVSAMLNFDRHVRIKILKKDGLLLTSTDYWPEKTINTKCVLSKGTPDKIFDRSEIEAAVVIAEKYGLKLIEPIDYRFMNKVVHWSKTGLDYTFIFFAMKK